MSRKKVWVYILIVLVILIIIFGVYFLFFRKQFGNDFFISDQSRVIKDQPMTLVKNSLDLTRNVGDCLIFEKKNCVLGKPSYEGEELINVGFNLEKESYIFSPINGEIQKTQIKRKDGVTFLVVDVGVFNFNNEKDFNLSYTFIVYGDILDGINSFVNKGQPIIKIKDELNNEENIYLKIENSHLVNGRILRKIDFEKMEVYFED